MERRDRIIVIVTLRRIYFNQMDLYLETFLLFCRYDEF